MSGPDAMTTHWNYRIFKVPGTEGGEDFYTMREVYYDEGNKPAMHSAEPSYPSGTSITELRENLQLMLKDVDRNAPVLSAEDFKDQP
jgi:hypothetical protein